MSTQLEIEDFLARLNLTPDSNQAVPLGPLDWCGAASDDELYELLARVAEVPIQTSSQDVALARLFGALLARNWTEDDDLDPSQERLPSWLIGQLGVIYQRLSPMSKSRAHLTQIVSTHGDHELSHLVEWLIADPPADVRSVLLTFAPLFQRIDFDPDHLFPRLLDAIAHPVLAASVLDLANYITDRQLASQHPAVERAAGLVGLLGELTHRLGQLEESVGSGGPPVQGTAQAVEDSIALAVSLCRALALIGNDLAIGKLFQALELRHRRLRAEAAAALASLGQPAGVETLGALAAEPVVRLRVLSYAAELGCLDQIDGAYQTAEARAEAELTIWLAQPAQMGMPPSSLECVDSRSQYWPGYDDEIECFLFRFSYQLAEGAFSNIGIAGPLAHAFSADLGDLSVDEIYAAFAGWQAEHEDIYEIDVSELHEAHQSDLARFERRLSDDGYEEVRPLWLGFFFGDRALVVRAKREGVEGVAVVDLDAVHWHSTAGKARPAGPEELYFIYKGKKLLRNFNED